MNAGIQNLREAVAIQDGLHYNEPADWFFPVRESLGRGVIEKRRRQRRRKSISRRPRTHSSQSAFAVGPARGTVQQHRDYDAGFIKRQFEASWKGGISQLKLDDLV